MRTTLTLDDDVADRLVELARETRKPFKTVVNETLRQSLGKLGPEEPPFDYIGHAGYLRAGIDDRRFNELAWAADEELPGSSQAGQ